MKRQYRVKLRKKNGPTISCGRAVMSLLDDQWLVFAAPGFSSDFWIEVSPTKPADKYFWRSLEFEEYGGDSGSLVTKAYTSDDETHWCKKGLRQMGINPVPRTIYWRRAWEVK